MKKSQLLEIVFVLVLFTLFAGASLCVTLFGANGYQNIVQRHNDTQSLQLPLAYLSNKVRQCSSIDAISLESDASGDYLVIKEETDGALYYTYLYTQNGGLYELYTASAQLEREYGVRLLEIGTLEMKLSAEGIQFTSTNQNQESTSLFLRMR